MFTSIDKLIRNLPRHSKTNEAMFALSIRRAFADVLLKNGDLPKEIMESAKATSFKNGELTVKVQGLARTELLMRAGALIKDINERLGKKVVLKLRFKTG